MWTISTFVDDQDRRAREECLNAFKERILHSCNALPQTQRQVAKNVAKMRSDLHLDDSSGDVSGDRNRNFLMVFHLAKSALVSNPTEVRLYFQCFSVSPSSSAIYLELNKPFSR